MDPLPPATPPDDDDDLRPNRGREDAESRAVAAYLRRHPDFLLTRPDLLAVMLPPERRLGDNVVDFQHVMLERLRTENARLRLAQRKLVATARANAAIQAKVLQSIVAMVNAPSFEHLIGVLTQDLTDMLDVDAIALCVEAGSVIGEVGFAEQLAGTLMAPGQRAAGVQVLGAGAVDQLLGGPGRDIHLRGDVHGDAQIYGGAAGLVRSDALVRLRIADAVPMAMLALGSRKQDMFHGGQGTELLACFAQVIEAEIRAWLNLAE